MNYLTDTEIQTIADLRSRNFAVCVFLPKELDAANISQVEEAMCEAGWNAIHWTQSPSN